MKTRSIVLLVALCATLFNSNGQAQGVLNGGFELYDVRTGFLANWHVIETGAGQTKDWATTQDGVTGSTVRYRVKPEGFPGVSINFLEGLGEPINFKEGKNFLYADGVGRERISLSQDTLVPADASSLVFRAQNAHLHYMEVAIDHVMVPFTLKQVIVPNIPSGFVSDWWVDVSAYRGKTVNLDFAILSNVALDRIHFSSEPVPEPQLLGALAVLFGAWWRRTGKS